MVNKVPHQKRLMVSLARSLISVDYTTACSLKINVQLNENEIIITDKNSETQIITISLGLNTSCNAAYNNNNNPTIPRHAVLTPTTNTTVKDQSDKDETLTQSYAHLREGFWYHLNVSIDKTKALLKDSQVGTFLLRDSHHPLFIFTLSVSTHNGVSSIRIGYRDGLFYLDCDEHVRHKMPHFRNVVELIYFYSGRRLSGRNVGNILSHEHRTLTESQSKCVWVDAKKRKHLPVQLTIPKLQTLPSLKHACRLRINSCIERKCEELEKNNLSVSADHYRNQLQLPKILKNFLQNYPYAI